LALHGHGPGKAIPAGFPCDVKGRAIDIAGERDYAVQAAQRGYVALAPDQLGFGELMLDEDLTRDQGSSCQQLAMRCMMAGTTAIGQRVLQAMVCFDYLSSLPEVDSGRLVVMGQSGGGTTSLFTGALDERVWATVVSCYFCTFRHSILAMHHCVCNYVPHLYRFAEMYDIAALVAPRLLYIISGRQDPIFPRSGVQLALQRIREVYDALGTPDNLGYYEGPEGHRFYAAEVWEWLARRV
ncbi:MAG: acetylxylan esterase, partial [Armatimonadetes bacterium]|nr:acetylxylan esterase [Armatimonadota bacterium]